MKDNDIIERLHKAYDKKEPDVLSKLSFSQVEMVPPAEKKLGRRYISAVAVYAAACLVVAITLPFIIGGRGDEPSPQPGMSAVKTETDQSSGDERNGETAEAEKTTPISESIELSLDYTPIPVESSEKEIVPEPETPGPEVSYPEESKTHDNQESKSTITTPIKTDPAETTTTSKRIDPVGTSTTKKQEPAPAPTVYGNPADHVRVRFYKDKAMRDEHKSAAGIPAGAKVYYKIETDAGYVCTNFSINVFDVGCEEEKDGLVGTNYYPFFYNNYNGGSLQYSLTAVLAGDADGNLKYDDSDVETINKYLAKDTTTLWLYGHDGYSEKLDYNCDGVVNVNDRMQLQSEINTGTANRQVIPYYRYSKDIGTITHYLSCNINKTLPHGRDLNSILTDGVAYTVYDSTASINELSDEIKAEYDDNFFMHYDLVLVYCYTKDGEIPGISNEIKNILYTTSRSGGILNPVLTEVTPDETLSEYAVCIVVSKRLNVVNDYPM